MVTAKREGGVRFTATLPRDAHLKLCQPSGKLMSIGRRLTQAGLVFSGVAAASCSLMLSREHASQDEETRVGNGGQTGAEPAGAAGVDTDDLDAGDAEGDRVAETGPSEPPLITQPDATPEAGVPDVIDTPVDGVLRLAFIEDPDEGVARLQLVDVREALFSIDSPEVWRRSLGPQGRPALDFSWSPGGRYVALRYQFNDEVRFAFFAGPGWTELPLDGPGPASQAGFRPTADYVWSPDGSVLAVALESDGGPLVGGFRVGPSGAAALTPLAFSSAPESMAWASASRLFVVHNPAGGRQVVVLEPIGDALSQELLDTAIVAPLTLRTAPGGVLGASDAFDRFLQFWAPAGNNVQHNPRSYLSSGSSFVAVPGEAPPATTLYAISESASPLASLPNCPTVLTWIEGPRPGALAGSKLACHAVVEGVASLTVYAFDENAIPNALTLDHDTIRTAFAVEADWATHARSFSAGGEWLALTTATSDAFIDLRGPGEPGYYIIEDVAEPGATARTFSPSGEHLLMQRGQQLLWLFVGTDPGLPPEGWSLPNTAAEAVVCSSTRNASNWCGAPRAAELTGPRWAPTDDIAVSLSEEEGLVLTTLSGSLRMPVSTCGADCVRGFAFSP
jgi:hypothetical protein